MKKILSIFLALVLVMTSTVVFAKNGNGNGSNGNSKDKKYYNQYENYKKSTSIFINGKEYTINNGNVIKYKNFQIPTKPITEGLEAKVNWNDKTHILTITKGNISLVLNLDTKKVKVNGFEIKNSVLTSSNKNKTIVLLKFIAEVLGKNAEINEGTGTVIIEDDGSTSINDNITGKDINQFQYSSKWSYGSQSNAYLEDNHWSSSRNAYYTVRFSGTQIKLYGATSNMHGIAGVSIDNGPEILVDFYSAKRADNVLVYTSPVLNQGQHTLKVRVTGTKNKKSKGYNVTADRVNIITNGTPQAAGNIALNKSSFTDSQQPQNTAQSGNDGYLSTRWCASNDSANHWWTVDLGALYRITGSEVTWEKSGKVYKYRIEVSSDNTNWNLKVDKTNNTNNQQVQADNFNADSVRYVRISVTGLETGCWASFSEFKVFGSNTNIDTKAPAVPTGLVVTAQTSNEVSLNWKASTDNIGTVGYKIFRNGTQIGTVTSGTSYRDTGLTAGTVYVYSVVAFDAAGNCSNNSPFAYAATSALNGSGNGLKGEYYNNKDLTDLKFTRTDDVVNAAWNNNSPDSRIENETFSIRWTGQIQPLYSEKYTFYTTSDDGVRLWINGTKIIDNWTDHSASENSGTITLTAGRKYDIKLEYYNNSGEGKITLEWSNNSQAKQIVPKSQLYSAEADTQAPTTPTGLTATVVSANQINLSWTAASDNIGVAGYRIIRNGILTGAVSGTAYSDTGLAANTTYTYQVLAYDAAGNTSNQSSFTVAITPVVSGNGSGLKGAYFDNMDFTNLIKERTDESVNFSWGANAPISSMGPDEFSIRWTGQIQPLYSDTYTFYTVSDDGVRLWINGTKVIDNWADHSEYENSGTITLTAGQKYDIKYEYYENSDVAEAKLLWSSPKQTKQIVPKSQLYSAE
jgi:chitodextrinase